VREANLALFEEADFFAILLHSVTPTLVFNSRDACVSTITHFALSTLGSNMTVSVLGSARKQ
jgi:hypothetical protein